LLALDMAYHDKGYNVTSEEKSAARLNFVTSVVGGGNEEKSAPV
jgi:hypothetical protein